MDRFNLELRADTLTVAQAETLSAEDGLFGTGTPSERQMEELRKREMFLDPGIQPEELFTWPIQAINNMTHAKNTWMSDGTLANFAERASSGRGIPYLRDHNTGQGTTGRVFHGVVVNDGEAEEFQPVDGVIPTFRDLFRESGDVLRLYEQVYMLRDGTEEERAHVAKLRAGVQASNSVGLGIYGALEPGSFIECDACKVDLWRVTFAVCPHMPGFEYEVNIGDDENPDIVVALATAKVVNGQQNEVSGVYLGAVPDTFTERVRQLFLARHLSEKQARRAEEMYQLAHGQIVGDQRSHSLPARAAGDTKTKAPQSATTPEGGHMKKTDELVTRVLGLFKDAPERKADLELHGVEDDPVLALNRMYEKELEELKSELESSKSVHEAMKEKLASELSMGEDETLGDALSRIKGSMKVAGEVRGLRLQELAKQMTRAGIPTEADEVLTKSAAGWDFDEIEAQITKFKNAGDSAIPNGRVSDANVKSRNGDNEPLAAALANRKIPRV